MTRPPHTLGSRLLASLAVFAGLTAVAGFVALAGVTALAPAAALASSANATPAPTGYSAAALYNRGNAYARAGQPGLAVLSYERARLLAPNDPDIEANLRYVRLAAHQPAAAPSRFARAVTVASPTVIAWLGVAGIGLIGAALLARSASRRRGLRLAAAGLGLALVGWTVCNGIVLWPAMHSAVVITGTTPVRVSPVPMGDPLFTLPEAETVRMTAQHEDFVLIRTSAGKTGWVSRADLVPVVPQ